MRHVAAIAALVLYGLTAGPALAWPLASELRVVGGALCFPDHAEPGTWWYIAGRLELQMKDGQPAFSLQRFRYIGAAATGDRGKFWARGVLAFAVRFAVSPSEIAQAERELSAISGRSITLRPLPVSMIRSTLLYAEVGEAGAFGSLAPGAWEERPGGWGERDYSVGLAPATTDLLWEGLQRGALVLSLSYDLRAEGLARRPVTADDLRAAAPESLTFAAGALPIRVDPTTCAACFSSTDLDASVPAGYTFLDVYCYDFDSALAPDDLAVVLVRVRAEGVAGTRPLESVRFERGEQVVHRPVHFKFAVALDGGYDLRVDRVYADGRLEEGAWQHTATWSGIQDVTVYAAHEGASGLDPRALY
jgi:hypothetical protein